MPPEQLDGATRFAAIARRIAAAIDDGAIAAGERLPSVRRLSRQEGVSMTTALAAMRLLESHGYVTVRPQSGHFARRPARLPSPARSEPPQHDGAPAIAGLIGDILSRPVRDRGFSFGEAVPAPTLLPLRAIARRIGRLAHREGETLLGGLSGQGLAELRAAIAGRMARAGCTVHPDAITITGGAADAVALALRAVTTPGDLVALESPTYYGLLMTAASCGLRIRELPTDPTEGLDPEAFAAMCASAPPRALVLSANVQNPTGACMPEHRKRELVALAARYGVTIVEDDVFGEYARHAGAGLRALKAHDPNGTVIYCSSFSKVLAPGLRVGWIIAGPHHDAVLRDRIAQSWGAPLLNQKALALSLREASYEQHMRRMVHTLGDTRARALDLIARRFPAGTRIAPGVHGFLLWLQLPDGLDGYAFHQRAMARDIVVMPGFAFSATGGFRDCIRLSLGHPWSPAMADALAALGDLADRMLTENARLTASGHGAAGARRGPGPSA